MQEASAIKQKMIDELDKRVKGQSKMTVDQVLASAGVKNHRIEAKMNSTENLTEFLSHEFK